MRNVWGIMYSQYGSFVIKAKSVLAGSLGRSLVIVSGTKMLLHTRNVPGTLHATRKIRSVPVNLFPRAALLFASRLHDRRRIVAES